MAAAGSSLAGAAVSASFLKQHGRPPDCFINRISASWNIRTKHSKAGSPTLHLWVTLYVLLLLLTQLWGNWSATRKRERSTFRQQASVFTDAVEPQSLVSWCQYTLYANLLNDGRACIGSALPQRRGLRQTLVPTSRTWKYSILLCSFLLLCGDIHLNPGPGNHTDRGDAPKSAVLSPVVEMSRNHPHEACMGKRGNDTNSALNNISGTMLTCLANARSANTATTIAEIKQQNMKLFETVNHASVLWNSKTKPKGIFGGHLNIRSVVSKTEQIEHLLTDSNLDYLCLTETWLTPSIPSSVVNVPG